MGLIDNKETSFDLDLFVSKTSRNETNHFHIYVDDESLYEVENGAFVEAPPNGSAPMRTPAAAMASRSRAVASSVQ